MVFKELIKIPVPPAPETDIPDTTTVHVSATWYGAKAHDKKVNNYIYIAEIDGEMLIVTVYHKGKFKWRTFIGTKEYYTQHTLENPRKSTASVGHISEYSQSYAPINGADQVIRKYVSDMHIYDLPHTWGNWDDGMKTVAALQKYLRDKKTEARHQRIREATEKCMLEIRPPIKAFTEWIKHQSDDVHIIYHTKDDYGVCTHCMKKVTRGKWKHRDKITCPHCHKEAQLICSGRLRDGRCERHREFFWYIQKTSEGCCARLFKARYTLCKNTTFGADDGNVIPVTREWNMCIDLYEEGRYFLDYRGKFITGFEWDNFMQTGTPWWCERNYGLDSPAKLYTGNLRNALSHYEQLKYIPWDKVAKIVEDDCEFTGMLGKIILRPWIEYLIKEKMLKLAKHYLTSTHGEISLSDFYGGTKNLSLAHILGLNRRELREIIPYDPTYHGMKLYKYLLRHRAGIDEWKQLVKYADSGELSSIISALEYQPVERYLRYIQAQEKLYQEQNRGDMKAVIGDYADYIREAVNANYDMNNTATINPKNLIAAHADSEIDSKLEGYRRGYEKYADQLADTAAPLKEVKGMVYEDKEFRIVPIMSWTELFNESRVLRHCVATYADKYAEGRCIIIGIRNTNTPDMPMYTLELSPDYKQIRQCRGFKNASAPEKIMAVVDKWHTALISKNTKKAG